MKRMNALLEKPYSTTKMVCPRSGLKCYSIVRNNSNYIKSLFPLITFVLCSVTQFAQDPLWTQKTDLNHSRWHLSANYFNGKIYAIGGVPNYHKVEEYDIISDTWLTKDSMPTGRAFVGSGVVDGKIYIIGGARYNGPQQDVVEAYDPIADEWTTVQSMTSAREGMASCVYDNKIYIFGGFPADRPVEAYDPVADTWISDLNNMTTGRWEPECVLVADQIYVIGGFLDLGSGSGQASNAVEVYHPETDSWSVKAPLPEKRIGGTAAYLNGKIYYFGGSSEFGSPKDNVWVYDPEIDQWDTTLPDMPFAWFLMASCVVDEKTYLISGSKVPVPGNENFRGVYTYIPDFVSTIENRSETERYRMYPNPVTNSLHLKGDKFSKMSYTIFDAKGIIQLEGLAENGFVRTNKLDDGLYFIIFDDSNNRITQSFLKMSY